jgi:hypothetical protein
MSKFKMLLQRFVQEYLCNTCTMWIYMYIITDDVFANNLDNFQTYSVVHGVNTRNKYQRHRPTLNLSYIQKPVFYSSIKIFNSLPTYILKLKQKKPKFKVALRECLIAHSFYSVGEFLSNSQITFPLQHQ